MSSFSGSGPQPAEKAEPVDLSAQNLLEILAEQSAALRGVTERLEHSLGATLCDCTSLREETLTSFQEVDFMRQALKDLAAILQNVAPHVVWRNNRPMLQHELCRSVDMQQSLERLISEASKPDDRVIEIW